MVHVDCGRKMDGTAGERHDAENSLSARLFVEADPAPVVVFALPDTGFLNQSDSPMLRP